MGKRIPYHIPINRKGLGKQLKAQFGIPERLYSEVLNDVKHYKGTKPKCHLINYKGIRTFLENGDGIKNLRKFLGKVELYNSDMKGISKRGIGSKTFSLVDNGYGAWFFRNNGKIFGYSIKIENDAPGGIFVFDSSVNESGIINIKDSSGNKYDVSVYELSELYKELFDDIFNKFYEFDENCSLHIHSSNVSYNNEDNGLLENLNKLKEIINHTKFSKRQLRYIGEDIDFNPYQENKDNDEDDAEWRKIEADKKYTSFINEMNIYYSYFKDIYVNGVKIDVPDDIKMIWKIIESNQADKEYSDIDKRNDLIISKNSKIDISEVDYRHCNKYKIIVAKDMTEKPTYFIQPSNDKYFYKIKKHKVFNNPECSDYIFKTRYTIREISGGKWLKTDNFIDVNLLEIDMNICQLKEKSGKCYVTIDGKHLKFMCDLNKENFKDLRKSSWANLAVIVNYMDTDINPDTVSSDRWFKTDSIKKKSTMDDDLIFIVTSFIENSCLINEKKVEELENLQKCNVGEIIQNTGDNELEEVEVKNGEINNQKKRHKSKGGKIIQNTGDNELEEVEVKNGEINNQKKRHKSKGGFLYIFGFEDTSDFENIYKFGKTSKDINTRLQKHQNNYPTKNIVIHAIWSVPNGLDDTETTCLSEFQQKNIQYVPHAKNGSQTSEWITDKDIAEKYIDTQMNKNWTKNPKIKWNYN